MFGLSHLRNQFEYGVSHDAARQEVINRLQFTEALPTGVVPQLSPTSPTGEIYRYTLKSPQDRQGRDLYTLNDLKSLQDWNLERQYRRVPRIIDVSSAGGTVKRYEIQPDPERLRRYGISLQQLQTAVATSNSNVGGDYLRQGGNVLNVRALGLFGGGQDPTQSSELLGLEKQEFDGYLAALAELSAEQQDRLRAAFADPQAALGLAAQERQWLAEIRETAGFRAAVRAAEMLRRGEQRRLEEIRQVAIVSTNNLPVHVEDVVAGGPREYADDLSAQGVVVSHQTRLGRVSLSAPQRDAAGQERRGPDGEVLWHDAEEKVQGIVLLRKGDPSLPALHDVAAKTKELNETSGSLLPGAKIEPYYDRTELINVTTETVRENLLLGMSLVTVILVMFLSNVRSALIVAVNIPLALLFAFSVLFLRGKSANLLSIGAVDFGIIVDSSVIMVENIYRCMSSGEYADLPFKERILRATGEVERSLFFSTVVMLCAFLPLFTLQGAEGQIFGPMADTYAFALGGALLLALTLAPVLCAFFFRNLKPARDNILVRYLKARYLWQLKLCLNYRWVTLGVMGAMVVVTAVLTLKLGREFMPELEEGNLWIRGMYPVNASLESVADGSRLARRIIRQYPEVRLVANQIGRPDDGTDPEGFNKSEFFVPLRPEKEWPAMQDQDGLLRLFRAKRPRSKLELVNQMDAELKARLIGVDWNFSQNIRDNVMEALSGVKGDNSVKIVGPNLDELEQTAERVQNALQGIPGVENVGILRIMGRANLELAVNSQRCGQWGVSVNDVDNVVQTAVGGKAFSRVIEGEKSFDLTLRWPEALRSSEQAILEIPVDVGNNQVTPGYVANVPPTRGTGAATGVSSSGTALAMPSPTGSVFGGTFNNLSAQPRRPLRDLVSPVNAQGQPDPDGQFVRPGASMIFREQGHRMIAVKFSVRGRDLAGAVAQAQQQTKDLIRPPYRAIWSGEFEQMQEAEGRLLVIIPLSLIMILLLLYLAFRSWLDAGLVFCNVGALSMGGVWALWLTGTNFSISAAVGFVSIFGVAIMDGLLLISYCNRLRYRDVPLYEAILQGAEKRVRPMMMTALTAIFGLLPAALSTRIGAQTQRPLAIVVVGGMIATLLLNRYLMPVLYSFYGGRKPPANAGQMAH